MKDGQEINVLEILKDRPRVQNALRKAVQHAIRFHKIMGQSIYVWRDGRVVEIPPEDIVVDADVLAEPPQVPHWL
jgi:hypothetical protein